jgi:hypothetical protein
MRKAMLAAVVMLLLMTAPAFSDIGPGELELGLSWTPLPADESAGPAVEEDALDAMTGFHVGYVLFKFLYISWDSLVTPPSLIKSWTGFNRPGFLNLYDAGIRFIIKPVLGYVLLGMNNVYVYKQGDLQGLENNFGANLRLGLGVRFDFFGVNLSGTAVFPSFQRMAGTLKGLAATTDDVRNASVQAITESLVPSLNIVFYF